MQVQGDILFVPIKSVPKGLSPTQAQAGRHIFALGEVTGHSHSVAATKGLQVYRQGETTYCTIEELTGGVEVEHQEHGPITLDPGAWEIKRQVEWTDANEPIYVGD